MYLFQFCHNALWIFIPFLSLINPFLFPALECSCACVRLSFWLPRSVNTDKDASLFKAFYRPDLFDLLIVFLRWTKSLIVGSLGDKEWASGGVNTCNSFSQRKACDEMSAAYSFLWSYHWTMLSEMSRRNKWPRTDLDSWHGFVFLVSGRKRSYFSETLLK